MCVLEFEMLGLTLKLSLTIGRVHILNYGLYF